MGTFCAATVQHARLMLRTYTPFRPYLASRMACLCRGCERQQWPVSVCCRTASLLGRPISSAQIPEHNPEVASYRPVCCVRECIHYPYTYSSRCFNARLSSRCSLYVKVRPVPQMLVPVIQCILASQTTHTDTITMYVLIGCICLPQRVYRCLSLLDGHTRAAECFPGGCAGSGALKRNTTTGNGYRPKRGENSPVLDYRTGTKY